MASPLIVSLRKHKNFCGSKIKILSPAKINLYLNIRGKYPGGFCRLESIVERISLCDEISIIVKSPSAINISSNDKNLETSENLAFKAAYLLKRRLKIPFGFDIFLKKNIPIGSGLGGGSSNAASTLLGLNELLNLELGKQELYSLGAKLGSDVNFFLSQSQFAFLEGRGEKITPFRVKNKFHHFIIWPGIAISTKKVYAALKVNLAGSISLANKKSKLCNGAKLTKFFNNDKILRYALKKGDIFLIKKNIYNTLEKKAFGLSGKLRKAKTFLKRQGVFSKVTGSGSALYTVGNVISLSKINPVRDGVSLDGRLSLSGVKRLVPKKWVVFEVITF